jgi:hypothetical protein
MPEVLNKDCECWEHNISLVLMDQELSKEVIRHIYCPRCSKGIRKKDVTMIEEEGWLIEFVPGLLRRYSAALRIIKDLNNVKSYLIYKERRWKNNGNPSPHHVY